MERLFLNFLSLLLGDVFSLRTCLLGLGLLLKIIVMKGVILVVKSPDVMSVNLCQIVIVSIPL